MTLLAPIFLFGLLAIGLPIWLHRVSSDNPNRQFFSSSMFLEPGEPQRVLAKQLQYLLLLALRIGVLVLLALAFAGLVLQRTGVATEGESSAFHLIVLDTSLSMSHGRRWDRALVEARAIINSLGTTDFVQLVSAGRTTQTIAESSSDKGSITRALGVVEPGLFRIDYGELMDSVDGLLREVELPTILHIITDAQEISLPARFADLAPRIPLELQIYNVANPDDQNWSVDGMLYLPEAGELTVRVRGFNTEPVEKHLILRLNSQQIARQQIVIEPNELVRATFRNLDLAVGSNRVSVGFEVRDELEIDDQRFLVLDRPVPLPVLLVGNNPQRHDMLFLESALETLDQRSFRVERARPLSIKDRDLNLYAFVVITDVGSLGPDETDLLADYMETGGSVLMALDQGATGLERVPLGGQMLQTFSQLGEITGPGYAVVGAMDRSHPGLQSIDELRSAKFFRYVNVAPQPSDQVLIRLDNGSPLLVESDLGSGRLLLFTSSLDREWNDLPVQPVFVPFIAGLGSYLSGNIGLISEARLGSSLTSGTLGIQGGQIFDPRGDRVLGIGGTGDEVLVDQVGFYEVVSGGATQLIAINLDPAESNLTVIDSTTLGGWRDLGSGAEEQRVISGTEKIDAQPVGLWPWIVTMLLIIVLIESWVGNYYLNVRRGVSV